MSNHDRPFFTEATMEINRINAWSRTFAGKLVDQQQTIAYIYIFMDKVNALRAVTTHVPEPTFTSLTSVQIYTADVVCAARRLPDKSWAPDPTPVAAMKEIAAIFVWTI